MKKWTLGKYPFTFSRLQLEGYHLAWWFSSRILKQESEEENFQAARQDPSPGAKFHRWNLEDVNKTKGSCTKQSILWHLVLRVASSPFYQSFQRGDPPWEWESVSVLGGGEVWSTGLGYSFGFAKIDLTDLRICSLGWRNNGLTASGISLLEMVSESTLTGFAVVTFCSKGNAMMMRLRSCCGCLMIASQKLQISRENAVSEAGVSP